MCYLSPPKLLLLCLFYSEESEMRVYKLVLGPQLRSLLGKPVEEFSVRAKKGKDEG